MFQIIACHITVFVIQSIEWHPWEKNGVFCIFNVKVLCLMSDQIVIKLSYLEFAFIFIFTFNFRL